MKNDRYYESREAMRYTVPGVVPFEIIVFEYEDHYMVDIDYVVTRPRRSEVYKEIDNLVQTTEDMEFYEWDPSKPLLISPSELILSQYIEDRQLERVPRSYSYYLTNSPKLFKNFR